ncbi:MAG: hypothetical protein ACTSR2_13245, partial [Candidatus Hodarchaeales archaeon]
MRIRHYIQLFAIILMIGLILPQGGPKPVTADLGDDLFEDFEGAVFPAWTATGLWHIEDNTTSAFPIQEIPSGSRYAWYGSNSTGDYNTVDANGTNTINTGDLISDTFDLTNFTENVYLEFWSWAETELGPSYDTKKVYLSFDEGLTWQNIANITIETSDLSQWQYIKFDITEYKNYSKVQIKFEFDTVDAVDNQYRGWLIDDVMITSGSGEYFDLWIEQE